MSGPLPHRIWITPTADELQALAQMLQAVERLRALGWNEIMYCPKDGSTFDCVTAGSTGIHGCRYVGEWPNGRWEILDGDIWPTSIAPLMFRIRAALAQPEEQL